MSVRARIPSVSRDIELMISDTLAPKAQSKMLADFARKELDEGQRRNRQALGRVPEHDTLVDGVESEDLDAVRPNGRISFEFHMVDEVLGWIGEQLVLNSPVLAGTYSRSHVLFVDGVEAEPGNVPRGSEYIFISTLPQARKIERGLSPQAPDGVYEGVAAVASRRFGNIARIRYTFRAIAGGERNPAIVVTL